MSLWHITIDNEKYTSKSKIIWYFTIRLWRSASCSLVVHRYTDRIVIPLGDLQSGITPKCNPLAHGCARHTQSEYHRQKFYLHYWLLAYLCMQHRDTFSSLYTYNPFLPSDKAFFMYWPIIKQTYLEGKHDPTKGNNKSPCAIVETMSFISHSMVSGLVFLTAFSSLHGHLLCSYLQHSRCPILELHTIVFLLLFMQNAVIPAFC